MRLILFCILSISANLAYATECENEAKTWPRALVNLVMKAVDLQVASVPSVKDLAEGKSWANPFSGNDRTPENLSLRNSITTALKIVRDNERDWVRAQLKAELGKRLQLNQMVTKASDATKPVLHPKLIFPFGQGPNGYEDVTLYTHGWFDGRPIFVTLNKKSLPPETQYRDWELVLMDPFHSDPLDRKKTIYSFQLHQFSTFPKTLKIAEREGKTYVSMTEPDITYELNSKKMIEPALTFPQTADIVRLDGKEYSIWKVGHSGLDIGEIIPGKGVVRIILEMGNGADITDASIVAIDGTHYLTYMNKTARDTWKAVRVNLKTKERGEIPNLTDRWKGLLYASGGAPRAYHVNISGTKILDFKNLTADYFGDRVCGVPGLFAFNGADHLYITNTIFNLKDGAAIETEKIAGFAHHFEIFTFENRIYAFIFMNREFSALMQLTGFSPQ